MQQHSISNRHVSWTRTGALAAVLSSALAAGGVRVANGADTPSGNENLENIPLQASPAEMQWFRDAKFGLFIHWGPCSIKGVELSWGRNANRPFDINLTGRAPATPNTTTFTSSSIRRSSTRTNGCGSPGTPA